MNAVYVVYGRIERRLVLQAVNPADCRTVKIGMESETVDTEAIRSEERKTSSDERKRSEYQTPVTTEELIQVYDEINNGNPDNVLLDKVLANLEGEETDGKFDEPAVIAQTGPSSTEDLLAILEGDGEKTTAKSDSGRKPHAPVSDPDLEKALALKQLKELPSKKRKVSAHSEVILDVKIPIKRVVDKKMDESNGISKETAKSDSKKPVGDISFIEEDWNDEETGEKTSERKAKQMKENGQSDTHVDHAESNADNDASPSKRSSRVIKKKVIWDPSRSDNSYFSKPCTVNLQDISTSNGLQEENDSFDHTKITEETTSTPSSEMKSPKRAKLESDDKRQSIASIKKVKKKMSEVDRLLMDEGAVNMIYQLERSNNNANIPEITLKPNSKSMISISKEKRYLMNKTRIIKNAVVNLSKTDPDSSLIRTRRENSKKGSKLQEGCRLSREETTPDESIIIRRHSSSSFSSGCLSPRPQTPEHLSHVNRNGETEENVTGKVQDDLRKSVSADIKSPDEVNVVKNLNKTLKKKLKTDTSFKTKNNVNSPRSTKEYCDPTWLVDMENKKAFSKLSFEIKDDISHITMKSDLLNVEVLQELVISIYSANKMSSKAIVLTSQNGNFCKGLNLKNLLQEDPNLRRNNISKYLEILRELIVQLTKFKGAIVIGVNGNCSGFGIVLLSLADFVLISNNSTFDLSPKFRCNLPIEGMSIFNKSCILPSKLANEIFLTSRVLNATEVLQYNLASRVCETDKFSETFQSFVTEIITYPKEIFQIHKNVSKNNEDYNKFHDAFEDECLLLADYWCSNEGQSAIQLHYKS